MATYTGKEDEGFSKPLVTSREPVGPKSAGDKGTLGDQALMDAMAVIAIAWVILLFLMFSLRSFNI
jgi:hypothetical protein